MTLHSIDWPMVLGPVLDLAFSADEVHQLEAATFEHVSRAVRLRPDTKLADLPFATRPVPWFRTGHFVEAVASDLATRPGAFLQHAVGDYYIQDAGSMLALALCQVVPGQWVCDACAAPGGKSTGLLEQLAGHGLLVANEAITSRLGILSLALARSGYGNQLLTNLDVEQLGHLCQDAFDCVLVDAPCTGQSLVARGKQSLAAFSRPQIEHSSARQTRILNAAASLVKPEGRLVYATCSYSYTENEERISKFLAEHPGWKTATVAELEPWRSPVLDGCYRVWPHRDQCAGAFAALLVRTEPDWASVPPSVRRDAPRRQAWRRLNAFPDSIEWLTPNEPAEWWQCKQQLHRLDPTIPRDWIPSASAGIQVAEEKPAGWQPLFGSSTLPARLVSQGRCVTLSDPQAVLYAAGEAIRINGLEPGWCLVQWRDRALAWGKATRDSLKNHFPKALRQSRLIAG